MCFRSSRDPVEQNVIDGVEAYKTNGCDSVIAFGGGSALDAAKAIALISRHVRCGILGIVRIGTPE